MAWRDLSELFPAVGTEQRAGGFFSSSASSSLLGVDAQADARRAPACASATPSKERPVS